MLVPGMYQAGGVLIMLHLFLVEISRYSGIQGSGVFAEPGIYGSIIDKLREKMKNLWGQ